MRAGSEDDSPLAGGSTEGRPKTVVLFVEFSPKGRLGHNHGSSFPFLCGLFRSRGVATVWLCIAPNAQRLVDDLVTLHAVAWQAIEERIGALGATHVVLSQAPAAELTGLLESVGVVVANVWTPGEHAINSSAWWLAWVGLTANDQTTIFDDVEPVYECAGIGDWCGAQPVATLQAGVPCSYTAPLRDNPIYRDLKLPAACAGVGCAFCRAPRLHRRSTRDPIELLFRQLLALRNEPRTIKSRREFQVESAWAVLNLDRVLDRLVVEQTEPSTFHLGCRADELLSCASRLEQAIATAQRAGHQIHFTAIGAENFSAEENTRLNKNLSVDQIRQALDQLTAWEKAFPGTFHFGTYGGLGFILFTPWTTLEDLRINGREMRALAPAHARFMLTRRLMLLSDLPITELARRDELIGLATEQQHQLFGWLQRHCDPGCRHWGDDREIPWHFRHESTARVCAVVVRICARGQPEDEIHARLQRAFGRVEGVDLIDAFLRLIDLAERADADVDSLSKRLIERTLGSWPLSLHPREQAIREAFRGSEWSKGSGAGFTLDDVFAEESTGATQLVFRRGAEVFRAIVGPRSLPGPCFARQGPFSFSYRAPTTMNDRDAAQLMVAIARVILSRSTAVRSREAVS